MNIFSIYSITAGGVFISLFLLRIRPYLVQFSNIISIPIAKYLTYPFLLRRYKVVGPWTCGGVLIHMLYAAMNIFCLGFQASSLVDAVKRAGTLSLVNMIVLFASGHFSFYSDILGISRRTCQQIHRATAWMAGILLALHIIVVKAIQGKPSLGLFTFIVSPSTSGWMCTNSLQGAACMGGLLLFSIPFIRHHAYEIFHFTHLILSGFLLYGIWQHLPSTNLFPRLYAILIIVFLLLAPALQFVTILYRNGAFLSHGCTRVLVVCDDSGGGDEKDDMNAVMKVRVVLPRPMKLEAGQYINLWMPTVSLWSWAQVHPFTVISWSPEAQETLELFIQPRHGFSANLLRHACAVRPGSASFIGLITGPHGISKDVDRYESILVIASGFGIAAAIPYLKKLIYSYNTITSRTRRVHFVWQMQTLGNTISSMGVY
jgi:hypothetical protein